MPPAPTSIASTPNFDLGQLFDVAWYLQQNPDVLAAGVDPFHHYLNHGWREERDPHPLFDTAFYLASNPDVAAGGKNPVLHFLSIGWKDGRDPHPLFDTSFYLESNPDVAASGENPLLHFLTIGWKDGRDPHPLFDTSYYLEQNMSVKTAGMNPLVHYLQFGSDEYLNPNPDFDTAWYLSKHEDVLRAGMHPLVHYARYGKAEGRQTRAEARPFISDQAKTEVIAYFRKPFTLPRKLPKIAIGCSSKGNFFMQTIALMLERELHGLGIETTLFDENTSHNALNSDFVLIVAPHEFFPLDGEKAFNVLRTHPALILLNTEQTQTIWFQRAEKYFQSAKAILDISFTTAAALRTKGRNAYFLPLGYSELFEEEYNGQTLSAHGPCAFLSKTVRETLPESYAARPIDILFIGTISPRRSEFFAKHASFFAGLETFIYLPKGDAPFAKEDAKTVNFSQFVALSKRSKILLNIHRDEHLYFEWQRIVSLGILQQTLVISDHCDENPLIKPDIHYIDAPLADIAEQCRLHLNELGRAENIAAAAYADIKIKLPLKHILQALVAEIGSHS